MLEHESLVEVEVDDKIVLCRTKLHPTNPPVFRRGATNYISSCFHGLKFLNLTTSYRCISINCYCAPITDFSIDPAADEKLLGSFRIQDIIHPLGFHKFKGSVQFFTLACKHQLHEVLAFRLGQKLTVEFYMGAPWPLSHVGELDGE